MKKNKVRELAFIGVMAALVFVTTNFLSIKIPVGAGMTQIHMGNVMCILSGLLFGPVAGGLASGIGSMFVDLLNPAWAPEFWITFIMKFLMGYIAGKIANTGKKSQTKIILGTVCGIFGYRIIYIAKEVILHYFILKSPWETVLGVLLSTNLISILSMIWNIIASIIFIALFNFCCSIFFPSKK